MQLADRITVLLENRYFRLLRGLADQLDRASVSVSNNIAEGFERGTTATRINYIYIAKGSAAETRSMLHGLAKRATAPDSTIRESRAEIKALIRLSELVSRQLQGWAEYLQNSSLKGSRHVTTETREGDERERRREAFVQKLKQIAPPPKDPVLES